MSNRIGARWRLRAWWVFALVTAAAVILSATGSALASSAASPSSTVWLCRPGLAKNPCETSLTTTVVRAAGSRTVQRARPASSPPIDCFYVYPTVSGQPTANANLTIDPEEVAVAKAQAARFSQVCRVYAPMYRQLTLASISGKAGARLTPAAEALAYTSMLAGWQDYLAHYNHGRGVVLIGHSQGSALLIPLIRTQIDTNPSVRRRLVSAILPGGNVTVARGSDVGGDFQYVPACHSASQTGCVVAYSSFEQPPPPDSLFGRVGQGVSDLAPQRTATPTESVLCVNPAAIAGGAGALEPYFPVRPFPGSLGRQEATPPTAAKVPTPWVEFPALYTAQCDQSGGATWLQVNDIGGQADHRPRVTQALGPTWGLHLEDVNLALGNLVNLVRDEGAAYRR